MSIEAGEIQPVSLYPVETSGLQFHLQQTAPRRRASGRQEILAEQEGVRRTGLDNSLPTIKAVAHARVDRCRPDFFIAGQASPVSQADLTETE